MAKIRIDHGARTHLPLCTCGWRGVTTTDPNHARRQATAHELKRHAGDHHRRRADRMHARRHAADS